MMSKLARLAGICILPLALATACTTFPMGRSEKHIQLFPPTNPLYSLAWSDEGAEGILGNTGYFVYGKKGDKETNEETARTRADLLGIYLLNHWDGTGENPLDILRRFDNGNHVIQEKEFFDLMNYLKGFEKGGLYDYYLSSGKI